MDIKPNFKQFRHPIRYGAKTVRLGSSIGGLGLEIVDEDGWIWPACDLMDGSREVPEIDLALRDLPAYPGFEVLTALVERFRTLGLLQPSRCQETSLSPRLRERFDRHLALLEAMDTSPRLDDEELISSLRKARVTVVGTGGTGSFASLGLAASGVGEMHFVDPDIVELSNLSRQALFTEEDVGSPKAQVLARRLNKEHPVSCTASQRRVESASQFEEFLRASDLLVMCADEPQWMREWANSAAIATQRPWVSGGYHGPRATAGIYIPGGGACYMCAKTKELADRLELGLETRWHAAERPAPTPANIITAMTSGSMAAHLATAALCGSPRITRNGAYSHNLVRLEQAFRMGPSQPRDDCPACLGRGS